MSEAISGGSPVVDPGKPQSAFRDQLAGDIVNVFLDLDFFGELHCVEHRMIKVVLDEDINRQAARANELGTSMTGFVLFCRESDIDRQLEGTQLEIDGRLYTVEDWRTDEGMHRVSLSMRASY